MNKTKTGIIIILLFMIVVMTMIIWTQNMITSDIMTERYSSGYHIATTRR